MIGLIFGIVLGILLISGLVTVTKRLRNPKPEAVGSSSSRQEMGMASTGTLLHANEDYEPVNKAPTSDVRGNENIDTPTYVQNVNTSAVIRNTVQHLQCIDIEYTGYPAVELNGKKSTCGHLQITTNYFQRQPAQSEGRNL